MPEFLLLFFSLLIFLLLFLDADFSVRIAYSSMVRAGVKFLNLLLYSLRTDFWSETLVLATKLDIALPLPSFLFSKGC